MSPIDERLKSLKIVLPGVMPPVVDGYAPAFAPFVRSGRPRGMMVTFGQTPGSIDPIAPVLLSQNGSSFLPRPSLFHYIERRAALETSANELFEKAASGKVRININQRFALKEAAEAHKAVEARATSGSTMLVI